MADDVTLADITRLTRNARSYDCFYSAAAENVKIIYLAGIFVRAHIASKQITPRYAIRYVLQHLNTADHHEALSVS